MPRSAASSGAERVRFVATSASRDASNAGEFVAGVREAFSHYGIAPEVISGDEEAALSFRGATGELRAHGIPGPYLVVDLGGGSTEFVRGTDARRGGPLGRHRLRADDRAAPARPTRPTTREIAAAVRDIDAAIDLAAERVDFAGVGRAGGAGRQRHDDHGPRARADGLRPRADPPRRAEPDAGPGGVRVAAPHDPRGAGGAGVHAPRPGRRHRRGGAGLARGGAAAGQRSASTAVITSEHDILDGIALSCASG